MTSFTFSLEQLRAAPPEVRRWLEHEIGAALGALGRLDRDQSQFHNAALAACTPEEALQMFELIKDNFLLSQVFFELAREIPPAALRRRFMRSTLPICCAIPGFPMVIGSPIVSPRSIRCFRPSAMTQRRRFRLRPIRPCLHSRDDPPQHPRPVGAAVRHGSACREPAGSVRHDVAACRPKRGYRRARAGVSAPAQSLTKHFASALANWRVIHPGVWIS